MSHEIHKKLKVLFIQGMSSHMTNKSQIAIHYFDEMIKISIKEGLSTSWPYAYKGESLFYIAQKMEDYSEQQLDLLKDSLRCFNKSLGIEEDEMNDPLVEIDFKTASEKEWNEPWIVAHRGEVLRFTANKMSHDRTQYYRGAISSFKEAIRLDANYAWAYAHWGATLYNQRDDSQYKEALQHFQKAIELTDHNYAWAYAYRSALLMEMDKEYIHRAYYDLLIAVRQNPNVVIQGMHPPAEFNPKLSLGRRYAEAVWQYQSSLEQEGIDETVLCYTKYYHIAVSQNMPKYFLTYDSEKTKESQKVYELIKELRNELDDYQLSHADLCYIRGGLTALELTEEIDQRRKEAERYIPTLDEAHGATIEQMIREEFKHLLKHIGRDSKSIKPKEIDELSNKAVNALKDLMRAIKPKETIAKYQQMARVDVAWYYLRTLKVFQSIVNV